MRGLDCEDMGLKVDGRQLHHIRFADDIVLITPSISQAERMLADFDRVCGNDIVLITPSISQAERMLADFDRVCGNVGQRLTLIEDDVHEEQTNF
ncbi:unnamed protein product [Heligmosomoides polygyrus]|uniref:Reverse transcriptase domain-containing protein n=1 Tax=Heligmosomoides polygyrus TaxID=6339 RepID=A0A183GQW8_HELPZ|nr:unnamed protein product [Heligmosomoides polygyrus]